MTIPNSVRFAVIVILIYTFVPALSLAQKPPITIDEFFNAVDFDALKVAPDGHSVVIGTTRAD